MNPASAPMTRERMAEKPFARPFSTSESTKLLLACGVFASLLYVALNIVGAMQWPGYSLASQAVSELSAINAPSRWVVLPIGLAYNVLMVAFGIGVWRASTGNRPLRISAGLLLAFALLGFTAPFTPMHMRGTEFTLTDTMHISLAIVTVILMFLSMAFGAAAFGERFRLYTIATIVALLFFGALTGPDAPRIAANQPTPFVGVYERINIGVFLLWVMVLAARLWHAPELSQVSKHQEVTK